MTEISRLLAKIENREMVLPEFQREFTWTKRQSLELIDSLLKNYPIGSFTGCMRPCTKPDTAEV